MSNGEIKNYLKKPNGEGCGYVAILNTILAVYAGRGDEFERKFGFPMYRNGDLNYDQLLVDFYATTGNREDGSPARFIDGGHAMMVTGVTGDGRYIVFAWGQKFYIDPMEQSGSFPNRTRMDFSTYDCGTDISYR